MFDYRQLLRQPKSIKSRQHSNFFIMENNLLTQFNRFELSDSEKNSITGGQTRITGCSQNGGTSRLDSIYFNVYLQSYEPMCDQWFAGDDAAGWCANMFN